MLEGLVMEEIRCGKTYIYLWLKLVVETFVLYKSLTADDVDFISSPRQHLGLGMQRRRFTAPHLIFHTRVSALFMTSFASKLAQEQAVISQKR